MSCSHAWTRDICPRDRRDRYPTFGGSCLSRVALITFAIYATCHAGDVPLEDRLRQFVVVVPLNVFSILDEDEWKS